VGGGENVGAGEAVKADLLNEEDCIGRALSLDVLPLFLGIVEDCDRAGDEGMEVGKVKPVGCADIERSGKACNWLVSQDLPIRTYKYNIRITCISPTVLSPWICHISNGRRSAFDERLEVDLSVTIIHSRGQSVCKTIREARSLLLDSSDVTQVNAMLLLDAGS
jgi:hypothetical protein